MNVLSSIARLASAATAFRTEEHGSIGSAKKEIASQDKMASGALQGLLSTPTHAERLAQTKSDLESEDKLGNFEIQDLMSTYNQAETLKSSVQKKLDDTNSSVIGKIG